MSAFRALDRPRWRHVWGEVWRFAVAALLGVIMFGIRLEANDTAGWQVSSDSVGVFSVTGGSAPVSEEWLIADFVVGAVVLVAMLFRRRWPLPIAALGLAGITVSSLGVPAAAVCIVSLASRRRPRDLYVIVPVLVGAILISNSAWNYSTSRLERTVSIGMELALFGGAWAWGAYRGARRELLSSLQERAATLEREQRLRVAQARARERTRIAQEMHDVLAHRISLIAVHANALAFRSDLPAAQVAEHAGVIRDNADHAVAELRDVLGVLRGGQDDATAPPQPTLDQLPVLLDDAQQAGTRVAAVGAMPDFDELPTATSRSAYRIIQECLTNARKHAPGLPVTVQIGGTEGVDLDIVVSNPLPGAGAEAAIEGTGMGLLGLAERVELAGGTLGRAAEDGFFVVRAHLPWSG